MNPTQSQWHPRWKIALIALVCAAPVVAALLAYYVWPPQGATSNYGQLIEPQRPLPSTPSLTLNRLEGRPFDLRELRGHWVMLYASPAACDVRCQENLFALRQIRLMTGKERDRVERVWLITDQTPLSTSLMRAYDGMWMVRANAVELENFLPRDTTSATQLDQHIWLIDPLSHLMMRFPANADPKQVYKDVSKLLYASRGWHMTSPAIPSTQE